MKTPTVLLSILSLALLSACGQKEAAAPAAEPAAVAVAAAPPAAENVVGKATYSKTCSLCHAANVAGAPKPGDKADWAPRIAQGVDVLYQHALQGFTGTKGQMPARGGSATLSDADVKATVDYMVGQSR
ncbi:c-type cytochrome [Duganella violaceipulchra]|uniref:C-type cytochrome n=1 Tax=Duganella violaceipulchra TaxID=2849652 RepID=A0AA41H9I7_9BURK|nr:c-type cytochrome [Duganella violaceicalia]MBV6324513.1 c-type cytochrome [Duganella violaceicalia]MCP2009219.1 cytochrome c5 [Duganella violaceicalia]